MGKRQRARERAVQPFASPLLNEYARHVAGVVLDGRKGVLVSLDEIRDAQAEADRVAGKLAGTPAAPAPTPEEMIRKAGQDGSRIEFNIEQRVWRKSDGKEGMVFDIKFDRHGNPTYRVTLQNGRRYRHHASVVHDHWSANRVYFPVDLETGRFILPAVG